MAKALKRGDGLEPAGFKRNEQMARRTDALQEEAETRSRQLEHFAIDPAKFKVENEIAQHFYAMEDVSRARTDMVYCWENFVNQRGYAVRARLSICILEEGKKQPCWEVVKGDMKESLELLAPDGTRQNGDVLLMRCRKDRYKALQKARKMRAAAHMTAADSRLEELVMEMGPRYVRLHRDLDDSNPYVRQALMNHQAADIAQSQFLGRITDGTVGRALAE